MTQLEKLHMELRRRKNEVFRKERETQELYRRYVSQYGAGAAGAAGASPGEEKSPKNSMPVLHEHSLDDIFWQSDLMHAKATEKHEATKDFDVGKVTDNFNDASNTHGDTYLIPPSSHSKPLVHNYSPNSNGQPTSNIDYGNNYGNYVGNNNDGQPPRTPDAKAPSASLSTKQNKTSSKHLQSSFDSPTPTSTTSLASTSSEVVPTTTTSTARHQENNVNTSASASPPEKSPSVCMSHQGETSVYSDILGGVMVTTKSSNRLNDDCDDSESTMSGLTTLDGATVVEAEWRLTEFLRVETENIRKMFAAEEELISGDDSFSNDLISDNSHPSIIVGEVSQAANEAEEMVRQMEKATAWMKDPTLLESDSEEEAEDDEGGNDGAVLEWSCFWSEEHEREYYYNKTTGQTCWTKPQEVEIDFSPAKKSRGIDRGNEEEYDRDRNEQDSVVTSPRETDADSVTVKDYTSSRRVLVESQALNPTEYTNEEMIDVFRPDNDNRSVSSKGSTTQSSKVLQYRRKRAKLRRMKRRLRAAFALLTIVLIALFVYRKQWALFLQGKTTSEKDVTNAGESTEQIPSLKTEEARVDAHEKSGSPEKEQKEGDEEKIKVQIEAHLKKEKQKQKEQEEIKIEAQEEEKVQIEARREEQEKKRKEEEASRRKLDEENEEKERTRTEAALQRKEEQVNQMEAGKLSEEKNVEEEKVKIETQEGKEKEVKQNEITNRHGKQQKDRKAGIKSERKKGTHEANRRPWLCDIPLAYLPSKKCRELATTNPIYDCQALTDCMME